MFKLHIKNYTWYITIYTNSGPDSLSKVPESELIVFKIAPKGMVSVPTSKKVMKIFDSKEKYDMYAEARK
ncbi:hypothetical protein MADE_1014770 [Alteromonas mediterranea DE]|uniref:Uncharacterized protein n=1 Tax=Alteromonas mediterranea (strain DSM 17117 / CIP 110805 / LMG 28347 / Deep ecotype) TaxID=1774373 RepID=F2GCD2_ALTMD|nr:hypothetical protein MADE_1014770 [Alteromonas mediterranea DE]